MTDTTKKAIHRMPVRSGAKAVAVLAIGVGVALGATGCGGYSQNWTTGTSGGSSNGTSLNWVYPK